MHMRACMSMHRLQQQTPGRQEAGAPEASVPTSLPTALLA